MSKNESKRGVLILLAVILFLAADGAGWLGWLDPYDDTDAPPQRSGMKIYRDALTGCEYLGRPWSTLTPRTDASGKQVCRKGAP